MRYMWIRFFSTLIFCLSITPLLLAQNNPKSHEDCLKLVPGDWGPNFGHEWHHHEAKYWGCRLGVPTETVKSWQQAANVSGMIQDILRGTIDSQDFVFVEQMEGSMHCYSFGALKKTGKGWEQAWEESGDDFCMMKCPPIRMRILVSQLVLDLPKSSSTDCKRMFDRKKYVWTGKTFKRPETMAAQPARQP